MLNKFKNKYLVLNRVKDAEIAYKITQKIEEELKGLKKLYPQESFDITTRLKYQIIAINGDSNAEKIRLFVDNMLLQDSRAFRKHVNEITPDLDMVFNYEDSKGDIVEGVSVPMNLNFLWPDASL